MAIISRIRKDEGLETHMINRTTDPSLFHITLLHTPQPLHLFLQPIRALSLQRHCRLVFQPLRQRFLKGDEFKFELLPRLSEFLGKLCA